MLLIAGVQAQDVLLTIHGLTLARSARSRGKVSAWKRDLLSGHFATRTISPTTRSILTVLLTKDTFQHWTDYQVEWNVPHAVLSRFYSGLLRIDREGCAIEMVV